MPTSCNVTQPLVGSVKGRQKRYISKMFSIKAFKKAAVNVSTGKKADALSQITHFPP